MELQHPQKRQMQTVILPKAFKRIFIELSGNTVRCYHVTYTIQSVNPYRVWIHSEMRTRHDNNIHSNAQYR